MKLLNLKEEIEEILEELENMYEISELEEQVNNINKIRDYIINLQQENKILRENAENNDKVVDNVNWENMLLKKENEQLKNLIDTILNFSLFKEECPLNFSFEDNSKEDKAQDVFYEDEYCENACNDDYRKCWLKYLEKMQELERGRINE